MRWVYWAIVVYLLLGLFTYRLSPLGQVPLLDAQEQLHLARQISDDNLPNTPYYRAPGYAALLAIGYSLGLGDSAILLIGQLLNLGLHIIAAVAIAGATYLVWGKRWGALLVGCIYAVYPVALYLSVDLLDTTLGQALLCGGLYYYLRAIQARVEPHSLQKLKGLWAGLAGGLWAVGILVRPQLAAVAIAGGVLLAIGWLARGYTGRMVGGYGLALVGILGVFGLGELYRTGQFSILPSQGSYNLWSANRPGASGEYYAQQIEFVGLPQGKNPAQVEAEYLYKQAHPQSPTATQAQIDAYWSSRFWQYAQAHPTQLLYHYIGKVGRLLCDYEGYNNKTYALQKQEYPLWRYNPLGFGIIALGALGTLLFYRPLRGHTGLGVTITLFSLTLLAIAIYYTSDRFRIILLPFVLIVSGGFPSAMLQLRARWAQKTCRGHILAGLGLWLLAAIVIYWPIQQLLDTRAADYMLMTEAASRVGDDRAASHAAQKTLEINPLQQNARLALVQARYNDALARGEGISDSWARTQLEDIELLEDSLRNSPDIIYIYGLAQWQLHADRHSWESIILGDPIDSPNNEIIRQSALAALMMTGRLKAEQVAYFYRAKERPSLPLLLAQASLGSTTAHAQLAKNMDSRTLQTTLQAWQKLFDRTAQKALNKTNGH